MEFSDDSGLNSQQYFPNAAIEILIDDQGRVHLIDKETIKQNIQRVDQDTSMKIVKAREQVLATMLKQAEAKADIQVPELVESARIRGEAVLGVEIERLESLQAVNPAVRDEEITFFKTQREQFENALKQARLRLDAVRVIITI